MVDRIIRIVTKNKWFFLLLLAGILLRFYRFEAFATFLGDQGRDALIVKRIVTFEHFPAVGAPSSIGQIYLGPFYYYLIAPFLLLTWFNPVGLALGVSLLWIMGIVVSFFITKRYLGYPSALLFSIFLIFSSTLIDLARFSWNPNLLPLSSFLTLYFLYRWIMQKEIRTALLFGSFLAFSIQLHYLALLLLIPTVGWIGYALYTHNRDLLLFAKQGGIALGAFLFFSLPLIVFDLRHGFININNFIALFTEGKIAAESPYVTRLVDTISSFVSYALQINVSTNIHLLLFVLVIMGSGIALWKKRSGFLLLHLVALLVFMLGFAYLGSSRIPHYYAPAYLSFYIILAGMLFLFTNQALRLTAGGLLAILFVLAQTPQYYYFWSSSNNQIAYARTVAESFRPYVDAEPIQIVALPHTETDGHFRYFLELEGYDVLSHDSPLQPATLFVICPADCNPTGDGQWQIAAFENKQLSTSWDIKDVRIYKIIHGNTTQ